MNVHRIGSAIPDYLKFIIAAVIVVICAFPEIQLSFSTGIDPPLAWVYNQFFATGNSAGKQIIFPHGPLAFFMYPLAENIVLAVIVYSGLSVLMMSSLLSLIPKSNAYRWLAAVFFTWFFTIVSTSDIFLEFNMLVITNVLLLYLNYYRSQKILFKLTAFLLTAFAFYVKFHVAIICGMLTFSFLVYYLVHSKKIIRFLVDSFITAGFIVLFWLVLYGGFSGLFDYCTGLLNLAKDNSSAAAEYPFNNWWLLGIFLVIVVFLPFAFREKDARFFGILNLLPLFAVWKHSMAREDPDHAIGLGMYAITSLCVFLVFKPRKLKIQSLFIAIAMLAFAINLRISTKASPYHYDLVRADNFWNFIVHSDRMKAEADSFTLENISHQRLPAGARNLIGKSTVDVYPWDYSIVAANHLNWTPRRVIHSYAAYTPWLDEQNAEHFLSPLAPEFFILEMDAYRGYVNDELLNGIDCRSLLNDEPRTMLAILRSYKPVYADTTFLIYQKRTAPLTASVRDTNKQNGSWGEWINVPKIGNGLLRLKFTIKKTFVQKLKSFLYKDEQFWIYLRLSDGRIHKYRFVPENARDGIWINPYIFDPAEPFKDPSVAQVYFTASQRDWLSKSFQIEWEYIRFDEPQYPLPFFGKSLENNDTLLFSSVDNFDELPDSHWTEVIKQNLVNEAFAGTKALRLPPGSFSPVCSVALDSLPQGELSASVEGWIKGPQLNNVNEILFVFSIEIPGQEPRWDGKPLRHQLVDPNHWNHAYHSIKYQNNAPNCFLKVYLWNNNKRPIVVDEMKVTIRQRKTE